MVIRWAVRALYVELFLSFVIVMGLWDYPTTIPFLGSVVALILPVLFSINADDWDDENADVHNCT